MTKCAGCKSGKHVWCPERGWHDEATVDECKAEVEFLALEQIRRGARSWCGFAGVDVIDECEFVEWISRKWETDPVYGLEHCDFQREFSAYRDA
jgi:hypothetical protein